MNEQLLHYFFQPILSQNQIIPTRKICGIFCIVFYLEYHGEQFNIQLFVFLFFPIMFIFLSIRTISRLSELKKPNEYSQVMIYNNQRKCPFNQWYIVSCLYDQIMVIYGHMKYQNKKIYISATFVSVRVVFQIVTTLQTKKNLLILKSKTGQSKAKSHLSKLWIAPRTGFFIVTFCDVTFFSTKITWIIISNLHKVCI